MKNKEENLKVPVADHLNSLDILDKFPELRVHSEFEDFRHARYKTQIIKYVIFAYDSGSSSVRNNSHDFRAIKEDAMSRAGFAKSNSGKFEDDIVDIMEMRNPAVNKMICCYLRYFVHSHTWRLIVMNEELMHEYMSLVLEPVDSGGKKADDKKILEAANIKAKLREECKSIANDLKSYYKELYGNNEDIKEEIIKPVRPETIVGLK